MVLILIAILTPFTLPKIVEVISSLSKSNETNVKKTNNPQEALLKCNITRRKTVMLDEKRFKYCQVLEYVNASMAKQTCERLNAR